MIWSSYSIRWLQMLRGDLTLDQDFAVAPHRRANIGSLFGEFSRSRAHDSMHLIGIEDSDYAAGFKCSQVRH
jgi:hypothetical protein